MNKRSCKILKLISEQTDHFTLFELAQKLDVSERTIREDLNDINQFLGKVQAKPVQIHNGMLLWQAEESYQDFLLIMDFYEYRLNKEERLIIESLILLCTKGYITLSEISDILFVSRSTVIGDLETLNQFLKTFHLQARGQPNWGIQLVGKEEDFRTLYFHILEVEYDLFNMFFKQEFIKEKENVLCSKKDRILIQNIVNEVENGTSVYLTQRSYQKLVHYLLYMVYRKSFHKVITEYHYLENEFTKQIYQLICQYFELPNITGERYFLQEIEHRLRFYKKENKNPDHVRVQLITRQFIEILSEKLEIPLSSDYHFFESLSLHLQRLIPDDVTSLVVYPEVTLIVEENQEILRIVKEEIGIIETYLKRTVTESELAYIVVYVCAAIEKLEHVDMLPFRVLLVCNSGIGTSQLLKARLEDAFHFQIMGVIPSHKILDEVTKNIDLIISTVRLPTFDIPSVQVTPLINDQDYVNLRHVIKKMSISPQTPKERDSKEIMHKIRPFIKEYKGLEEKIEPVVSHYFRKNEVIWGIEHYLTPDFIELDISCRDWKDAIRKASLHLLKEKMIEKSYVEAMIQNIEENGPYIVISEGFALPHAPISSGVYQTAFQLIRLKKPVSFNAGILDPIRYVCVLSAKNNTEHLNALFELVNLLHLESFKSDLNQARSKNDVIDAIRKHLHFIKTGGYKK